LLEPTGRIWRNDPQALIAKLGEKIGQAVTLSIKSGTQEITRNVEVGTRSESTYKVVELASPTADQLKVRDAWLKVNK
jgi:hypothetical protein